MTFNPLIPQATDLISNSQAQLLANNGQLNAQYGADHDGFNTGSGNGSGMHDQVTFLANQSKPSLTRNSVAGVSGLYCNEVSSVSCLFFQNSTQNIQLTGATNVSSKYITLPGGVIMQWGSFTISAGQTQSSTINFPISFPNAIFSVQITTQNSAPTNNAPSYTTGGTSNFVAYRPGTTSNITYTYIAIGN